MILLIPAALCSISIAAILKINERRGGDRVLLAASNYLFASILSLAILRLTAGGWTALPSTGTLILGGITGIIYVLGFLLFMGGIAKGPFAVTVTVVRLSVAVPVVVAIFLWNEAPKALQWAGLAAGTAAIILFGIGIKKQDTDRHTGAGFWLLMAAMFAVMGTGDVLLKAFREVSPDSERLMFTWLLFTSACLFTWLVVLAGRIPFDRKTFLLGLLLGVPNLFSTVFTLLALRGVPASIAFPFINLTVIFGSTVLAMLAWKERLSAIATAGLVLAALALILLPM